MRRVTVLPAVIALVLLNAGPAHADDPEAYVATIRTAQGKNRADLTDPDSIAKAQAELEGGAEAGVPIGELAPGDGGVNKGHDWHVVDLEVADFTMELCDGTARMVDRDTTYWVDTVGFFCPWSGEVVKLKPLR